MTDWVQKLIKVLATWFGCGRAPVAPGTFGTLGAIPLVWALSTLNPMAYMAVTLLLTVGAVFVCHFYEDISGVHDAPELVIDEVIGLLVTMTWVPFTWGWLLAGVLLFRAFDILKPFPISWVDRRIPGGVGAMADDLLAAVFCNIILQLLLQRGFSL